MPDNSRELELFAAGAHAAMAAIHGYAAAAGRMPAPLLGAALTLHGLALFYNGNRPENRVDVAKHAGALAALVLCPNDRVINALVAAYDAWAMTKHLKRCF